HRHRETVNRLVGRVIVVLLVFREQHLDAANATSSRAHGRLTRNTYEKVGPNAIRGGAALFDTREIPAASPTVTSASLAVPSVASALLATASNRSRIYSGKKAARTSTCHPGG